MKTKEKDGMRCRGYYFLANFFLPLKKAVGEWDGCDGIGGGGEMFSISSSLTPSEIFRHIIS